MRKREGCVLANPTIGRPDLGYGRIGDRVRFARNPRAAQRLFHVFLDFQ